MNVRLAEGPTRVMNALEDGPLSWLELRDEHRATTADMNLLTDLGFIRGAGPIWIATAAGRRALRELEEVHGEH